MASAMVGEPVDSPGILEVWSADFTQTAIWGRPLNMDANVDRGMNDD